MPRTIPTTLYIAPANVRRRRLPCMQDEVYRAQQPCIVNGTEPPMILHWDSKVGRLVLWEWPAYEDGRRVTPDDLADHRRQYYFQPPCCLCAYLENTNYKSSKISLLESVNGRKEDASRQPFIGEYVAECATNTCGYFVILERFYAQRVLQVKYYMKRSSPYNPNALDFLKEESELACKDHGGFRRIFVGATNPSDGFQRGRNLLKRAFDECDEQVEATTDRLDALRNEGLAEEDFWELFIQCASCNYVVPRHLYPYSHRCTKRMQISAERPGHQPDSEDDEDDFPPVPELAHEIEDPADRVLTPRRESDQTSESGDDDEDMLERMMREAEAEDALDDEEDLPNILDLLRPPANGDTSQH